MVWRASQEDAQQLVCICLCCRQLCIIGMQRIMYSAFVSSGARLPAAATAARLLAGACDNM